LQHTNPKNCKKTGFAGQSGRLHGVIIPGYGRDEKKSFSFCRKQDILYKKQKRRGFPVNFIQLAYFRKVMECGSVTQAARQLCITPKYLTTLIKRISGKSVSEWIDSYVILEAKTLLKYSNMSVQEIAYYLNFPNQSFFGSYFKRNTGMSPSQYKAKQ